MRFPLFIVVNLLLYRSATSWWAARCYSFPRKSLSRRTTNCGFLLDSQCGIPQSKHFRPPIFGSKLIFRSATTSSQSTDSIGSEEQFALDMDTARTVTPPLTTKQREGRDFDLPWNEVHDWALRDNLPRYTIQAPIRLKSGKNTVKPFILWRTLGNEVVELSGYPLAFLQDRLADLVQKGECNFPNDFKAEVLPFLDEYDFEVSGGLSGRVFGICGIADGTRIETTPVGDIQATIQKGFIRTEDGLILYELGRPLQDIQLYGLDGTIKSIKSASRWSLLTSVASSSSRRKGESALPNFDPDLIQLGLLTTILISGAAAFETLSHHLTIQVFWV